MTVLMRHYTGEPQKSSVGRTSRSPLRIFVAHPWLSTAHSGEGGRLGLKCGAVIVGETFRLCGGIAAKGKAVRTLCDYRLLSGIVRPLKPLRRC